MMMRRIIIFYIYLEAFLLSFAALILIFASSTQAFYHPSTVSSINLVWQRQLSLLHLPKHSCNNVPLAAATTNPHQSNQNDEFSSPNTIEPVTMPPKTTLLSPVIEKIGSTTSLLVAGTFYAVLCYYRDAFMVTFFVGALGNGILSKILKRVLQQARPAELDTSTMVELVPSDHGMPSSHAMSFGFIGTFTALTLPITAVPLLVYTLISLVYRVQTKLHTVEQVGVGVLVGSFNGAWWWQMCTGTNTRINIVDWMASTPLMDSNTGLLPWYLLSVPALVGAAVVGSVERRLARFMSPPTELEQRQKKLP